MTSPTGIPYPLDGVPRDAGAHGGARGGVDGGAGRSAPGGNGAGNGRVSTTVVTAGPDPAAGALTDAERWVAGQVQAEVARRLSEHASQDAPGADGAVEGVGEVGWLLIGEVLDEHARAAMRSGGPVLDTVAETRVARAAYDRLFGLGGFASLLADPEVENEARHNDEEAERCRRGLDG